jgi:SAM-dependent methyltransferase
MTEPEWLRLNRANWDERVAIHTGPGSDYDWSALKSGTYVLHGIEEAELGPVEGLRLLHLQCHFGVDTLALAQRGADVTGLDFSAPAIETARALAAEFGIKAAFVQSDVYAAREAVQGQFDRIYTTWGTIPWLPDIQKWARVIASLLTPGGFLYFADMHPAALVFDDDTGHEGKPGWCWPYFHQGVFETDDARDYADPNARLTNSRTHQFAHPLGSVVQALIDAGLRIDMLHEHDGVAWKAFSGLVEGKGRLWRFPDKPWLPLSYSIKATKP